MWPPAARHRGKMTPVRVFVVPWSVRNRRHLHRPDSTATESATDSGAVTQARDDDRPIKRYREFISVGL